jgi:hypothetical protein
MNYHDAISFLYEHGRGGATKSSGERVCAGIVLSLHNGNMYPFRLDSLGLLAGEWREAANTAIAGWTPDSTNYLRKAYGEASWKRFINENRYRQEVQP